MLERRAKYSSYGTNCEPLTPFGRKEQKETKKSPKVSQMRFDGFIETYRINHDILSEMKILHEEQKYSSDPQYVTASKMKTGLEKMEEKARTMGLYSGMSIDSKDYKAEEKKAIIADINEAKVLINTLRKQ